MTGFWYLPIALSFTIFAVCVILAAVVGLWAYKYISQLWGLDPEVNAIVGIFIGVISIFLGVMLSLIVVDVWGNYARVQNESFQEANAIYLMYKSFQAMPGTEGIQETIIVYLNYIIYDEYPALGQGFVPEEGTEILNSLQNQIFRYNPAPEDAAIYANGLGFFNQSVQLRIARLGGATFGDNSLFRLIVIIDSILLILMSYFLQFRSIYHYVLTGITAAYIATAIYLIFAVSNPFRGSSAVLPTAFISALNNIEKYPPALRMDNLGIIEQV